ncbi:RusA family crossover junction endodeoxyribonuclease [Anaerosolibacter sp.]|uniref:RusA family crossover junction endodeoxyribonuclease n=1 Tax=Anaerosolibacter sp. TaxID=1872527 RepID=UPI0039F0CA95
MKKPKSNIQQVICDDSQIRDELLIVIPEIPPSNNKYMGRGSTRTQAFTYQAEKQRWQQMIGWLVKQAKWKSEPIAKAVVEITYYFKDKIQRDPDNYSGKFILDSLVRAGVLKDDSFSNIQLVLKGDYDKKNPRTEVQVRRV